MRNLPPVDTALVELLERHASTHLAFVVSDARQEDCPIVYASEEFYILTGFTAEEVLGRNCRFLQGPDTERNKVTAIRDAIREERSLSVCLLNYKKDGTPFHNLFFLAPVPDAAGTVAWYVGVQSAVSPEVAAEADAAEASRVPGKETCDAPVLRAQTAALGRSLSNAPRPPCAPTPEPAVTAYPGAPATAACVPAALLRALTRVHNAFCLADPRLPDCPIVHASAAYLQLTGHAPDEVLGRNCRFLQGPGTDPAAVKRLRDGIASGKPTTVRLLNYRKLPGGAGLEPFWNSVHVSPVRDATGAVALYIGVQVDVTATVEAEAAAGVAAAAKAACCDAADVASTAQMGVVGAVRVAVRGLKCDGLMRHNSNK